MSKEVSIVIYTKPDCSLCERAEGLLDQIGHPYERAWRDDYAERIPVIEVDGAVVAEGRVDERAVRRVLRERRRFRRR